MGADLYALILVGPKELDRKLLNIETAYSRIKEIKKVLLEWKAYWESEYNGPGAKDLYAHTLKSLDEYPSFDEWEYLLDVDPVVAVEELLKFWNSHYRDTSYRNYGNKKIFVAGEPTWGNTPSGEGYRVAQQSEQLGLYEIFGIE